MNGYPESTGGTYTSKVYHSLKVAPCRPVIGRDFGLQGTCKMSVISGAFIKKCGYFTPLLQLHYNVKKGNILDDLPHNLLRPHG